MTIEAAMGRTIRHLSLACFPPPSPPPQALSADGGMAVIRDFGQQVAVGVMVTSSRS